MFVSGENQLFRHILSPIMIIQVLEESKVEEYFCDLQKYGKVIKFQKLIFFQLTSIKIAQYKISTLV
jgi:hypothetical protein